MEEKEEMSFEEAMKKLQDITIELEKGTLNLSESVEKFEEGMKYSKKCNDILNDAEKRINILIKTDDGIKEESFVSEE